MPDDFQDGGLWSFDETRSTYKLRAIVEKIYQFTRTTVKRKCHLFTLRRKILNKINLFRKFSFRNLYAIQKRALIDLFPPRNFR